jgi:hypothetical protein
MNLNKQVFVVVLTAFCVISIMNMIILPASSLPRRHLGSGAYNSGAQGRSGNPAYPPSDHRHYITPQEVRNTEAAASRAEQSQKTASTPPIILPEISEMAKNDPRRP